jgi:hypothetical protein
MRRRIPVRLNAFLRVYEETGQVWGAAKTARIAPSTHYRALLSNPSYRAAFDESARRATAAAQALVVSTTNEQFIRAMIRSLRSEANRLACELRKLAGDKPKQRRARVIALAGEGKTVREIADLVGLRAFYVSRILRQS